MLARLLVILSLAIGVCLTLTQQQDYAGVSDAQTLPTATSTATVLARVSGTGTISASSTATATTTATAPATATPALATSTAFPSATPTITRTPTRTPTITATPLPTGTRTPTPLPTVPTLPPTPTGTPTLSAPLSVPTNLAVSSITRSGATISWTTTVPGTSAVDYGLTAAYGSQTPLDQTLVTNHSVVLQGLQAGATYHVRVSGASVGRASPSAASPDLTFTTAPAGSGPDVLGVTLGQVTATTLLVSWTSPTSIAAQVEYGPTSNYGRFTLLRIDSSPTQQIPLSGLAPQTLYHLRVKAWDSAGYLGTSADVVFATAALGTATLLGDATLQPTHALLPAGQAAVFPYTASQSGLASRIRVFVDDGSTATQLRVALYADQAGLPGAILAQGSIVPVLGWNSILLPPASLTAGTRYWVAVLAPLGSGTLGLRESPGSGSQLSLQSSLAAFPATWTPGLPTAAAALSAFVQQVPPSVTITSPHGDSTATDFINLTAVVDDDAPITSLQFLVDGQPVGLPLRAAPFALTWNSGDVAGNTTHTITARATDALGRAATSGAVSFGVDNGPLISQAQASPGLTSSSARVTWFTDVPGDSQVEYGTTTAYGSMTPLETRLGLSHEQQLTGLLPNTTYHLRVRSRNGSGILGMSADFTFTTPPPAQFGARPVGI